MFAVCVAKRNCRSIGCKTRGRWAFAGKSWFVFVLQQRRKRGAEVLRPPCVQFERSGSRPTLATGQHPRSLTPGAAGATEGGP
jgi:hypothetical protein